MTAIRHPLAILLFGFALVAATAATAEPPMAPYPGMKTIDTGIAFEPFATRLRQAIAANRMGLVTTASASAGAARRGVTIPGNLVMGVFRNDFAVRMLKASVASGIEAPLRLYLTEKGDGTASLTYRVPSSVFAPYGSTDLDAMAAELDDVFAKIIADATAR